MRPVAVAFALFGLLACGPSARPSVRSTSASQPGQPSAPTPSSSSAGASASSSADVKAPAPDAGSAAALAFIHDDLPHATERARAEGKALFVDAWAPWCHTCLSVKNYVLSDPSLAPLAERVVFAALDTDRPESAAFLERYPVTVWPTFFVIDPAEGKVLGHWPGAASVREIKELVEECVALLERTRSDSLPPGDPLRDLMEAKEAHATGSYKRAALAYERAVGKMPAGAKRRNEALLGWLHALYRGANFSACTRAGIAHVAEVQGAAVPADYASTLLTCASRLGGGEMQRQARQAAVARLRAITHKPHPEASADDRADALRILAEGLWDVGDADGARAARIERLDVLSQAAKAARSPEAASIYDYPLAMALVALGRKSEAIGMLEQRERELPESYEPAARLAEVLAKIGRTQEALGAIDRSIARAYGPRRLKYLRFRAELLRRAGDSAGEVATLRQEVAGHEALAKGQANRDRLREAKRRLAEAEARMKGSGR